MEIAAVLDEEPEMDEHFTVTLLNPTGGARLGTRIHTAITVLQNQAPQGLFSIFPTNNRYYSFYNLNGRIPKVLVKRQYADINCYSKFMFLSLWIIRTSSLTVEESNATVYLKVSRSNGLNMSVSVEWETVSGSAFGISKIYI